MGVYNIFFSPTGGVKKVADIIAKELDYEFKNIDLTDLNADFSAIELKSEDIAIIAMPSYGGRVPKIAIDRLIRIKSNNASAVIICVYGNRDYEDALIEMQDTAKEIGFNVIAAIAAVAEHSIVRKYGAERPDSADEKQLKDFAVKIKERIPVKTGIILEINGNRPYKKAVRAGLIPKTTKACVDCKKCADLCPTGAISKTDIRKTDKNKCISCMRCVANCPQKAKQLNKIMITIISLVLKKVCTARKENKFW